MLPLLSQKALIALLITAILLPVAICVVLGVGSLLTAMGDTDGGAVLGRIALAGGIVWAIDLIGLVLTLAVGMLERPDDGNKS